MVPSDSHSSRNGARPRILRFTVNHADESDHEDHAASPEPLESEPEEDLNSDEEVAFMHEAPAPAPAPSAPTGPNLPVPGAATTLQPQTQTGRAQTSVSIDPNDESVIQLVCDTRHFELAHFLEQSVVTGDHVRPAQAFCPLDPRPITITVDNAAATHTFSDSRAFHVPSAMHPGVPISLSGINRAVSADVPVLGSGVGVVLVFDRRTNRPLILHIGGCLQVHHSAMNANILSCVQASTLFLTSNGALGCQIHTADPSLCYIALSNHHEVQLFVRDSCFVFEAKLVQNFSLIYNHYDTVHLHIHPDEVYQLPLSATTD